jgi:hypothetical protein
MGLWPYCFLALPLLNMVARIGLPIMDHQVREEALQLADVDHRVQGIVWCGIAALLALSRLGCLAFAWVDTLASFIRGLKCSNLRLSMILVKENAPTPDSLGATNGLVLFAMCLTRSFCPAFARYSQMLWSFRVLKPDVRLSHSSLFASLASSNILYGNLWAVIMATIAYACSLLGSQIERGRELSTVTDDCGLSE